MAGEVTITRRIYIYSGITPNRDKNTHYYFTNITNYLNALVSNRIATKTPDNYRLQNNLLRVTDSTANGDDATYVIEVETKSNQGAITYTYFRAYHVRSCETRSDMYIYSLEPDTWANYIYKAQFSQIIANRCNKNIGNGVYDDISKTENPLSEIFWDATQYGAGALSVVFLLRFVTAEELGGLGSVTTDYMFCVSLDNVISMIRGSLLDISNITPIDIASRFVGGIFAVPTIGDLVNRDAKVAKAWLVPSYDLNIGVSSVQMSVKFRTAYTGTNDFTIAVKPVLPTRKYEFFDLATHCDIDHKWYIGTLTSGFYVPKTTQAQQRVLCYFDTSVDELRVTLVYGDDQRDITSEFELPILGNSEVADMVRRVAYWTKFSANAIGTATSFASGLHGLKTGTMAKGYDLKKGVLSYSDYDPTSFIGGSVKGALTLGADFIGNQAQATGQNGQGNASLNYSIKLTSQGWKAISGIDANIAYPLVAIGFPSIFDEGYNVRMNGAKFSEPIADLSDVASFDFLGTGDFDNIYLQADCIVYGVPLEACDLISRTIRAGFYYKVL